MQSYLPQSTHSKSSTKGGSEREKEELRPHKFSKLANNSSFHFQACEFLLERASSQVMERTPSSSSNNTDGAGLLSCWGRLKLKLPWTKRRVWSDTSRARQESEGCNIAAIFRAKQPKLVGKFRYDPLSYAQNFDEGCWDDDDKYCLSHGFSSRYAVPSSSKSLEDK